MEKQFLETKKIKDFTKRCLNNESIYDYKGSIAIIKDYWNKAKTINEFKDLVLNDKRLKDNQGYWELAKEDIQLYDRLVLEYLGSKADKHFTTESDIGSLAVGTSDFKYNIGNLYGDGTNYVYILENNEHLSCLDFLTTIEGDFNIYDYDCGNNIAITLHGKYAIYRGEQVFVFVKWN